MAAAVRQSAYFQRLPELPVSCRQFDGDASNIPIIFEDVYLPLTEVSFLITLWSWFVSSRIISFVCCL